MLLFMGKIACATGHRPDKFDFGYNETDIRCINLKKCLKRELIKLIEHDYTHFISGMALGFDMWFAEEVLELKKTYPNIILEAAIPCLNQEIGRAHV